MIPKTNIWVCVSVCVSVRCVCLLMCECVISIGKWSVLTSHSIKVLHRVDWALTNKSHNNNLYYVQKIVYVSVGWLIGCCCCFCRCRCSCYFCCSVIFHFVLLCFCIVFVSLCINKAKVRPRPHSYIILYFLFCLNVRWPWSTNTLIELNINQLVNEQW